MAAQRRTLLSVPGAFFSRLSAAKEVENVADLTQVSSGIQMPRDLLGAYAREEEADGQVTMSREEEEAHAAQLAEEAERYREQARACEEQARELQSQAASYRKEADRCDREREGITRKSRDIEELRRQLDELQRDRERRLGTKPAHIPGRALDASPGLSGFQPAPRPDAEESKKDIPEDVS